MNQKNVDHVAVYPDSSGRYWDFIIPSEAMYCSEVTAELINIVPELMEAFGSFLTPNSVTYYIGLYSEDAQIPTGTPEIEPIETVERTVEDASGVDSDSIIESTQVERDAVRWIQRIPFENNAVNVRLRSGNVYVDRETSCVAYRNGSPLDRQPSIDPISVAISHYPASESDDFDAPSAFHISIEPRSDIWFKQSEIGRSNQSLLSSFLNRIPSKLPVEQIEYSADWGSEAEMAEIY